MQSNILFDHTAAAAARARLDQLTKPPGSLGRLEELVVQLAGVTGQAVPCIEQPVVVVAAADHGVTVEGVSPYPQAVTAQMVQNFLAGGAAINALARNADARLVLVDAGVVTDLPVHPELLVRKRVYGTANLRTTAAMPEAVAHEMVQDGVGIAHELVAKGADLIALGEMGIGNTTAAACLVCAYTGTTAAYATGRGTGLDDAGLLHKRAVVADAVARWRAASGIAEQTRTGRSDISADAALSALAHLGGAEIALLAGVAIGAAHQRVPVLLDGYITAAAALAAVALDPSIAPALIAAHRSAEPGHAVALAHLGLVPILQLDMRLGEGSGAALAIPVLRGALACHASMATFGEAGVSTDTVTE